MTTRISPQLKTLAASLCALAALTACNKSDEPKPIAEYGQPANTAQADAAEAREKARMAGNEAGSTVNNTLDEARAKAKEAGDTLAAKATDAVITTQVNAKLAQDPELSAAKINVDTKDGKVQLKGTAPDQPARERATQLAMGVEGVVDVDNQLVVKS